MAKATAKAMRILPQVEDPLPVSNHLSTLTDLVPRLSTRAQALES
jgi:hypothetical protein